ncbi:hypothetical protein C4D60_Mb09t00900 [Musa balbisiana]|uniref:TPX2 central domain-containing protein n=1 Tax=Musa balbisiana TaxID=52838 RepID=A0A4S8IFH7_MUSBA|nr:hypothetical protein C4D60_Mb09t00900 [Musa balbisiana]
MDDEMVEAVQGVFVCFEVDLDYEFDAPRYFDLGREETPAEAWAAELWFDTAGSHPPSPLIVKLFLGKDIRIAATSTNSDHEDLDYKNPDGSHADSAAPEFLVNDIDRGRTFHNSMLQGVSKLDHKSTFKNPFSKRSTLMKPTASQLAKQNRAREVKSVSGLQKQFQVKKEKRSEDSNNYTLQATKRQRLEKGHCCKGNGVKQQIDLFHKVPGKQNGLADANNQLHRLKLTIPREPDLETARRALSSRVQQQRLDDAKCLVEGMAQTTSTFKARPLNRKILEAPSLPLPQKSTPRLPKFKEFNFRTHDRALLHSTTSSSLISSSHIPTCRKSSVRIQYQSSGHQQLHIGDKRTAESKDMPAELRAQTLNQKIFERNGDGVFQTTKWEITVPKEFNFSTTEKLQQTPLTEHFNKLSLTSEAQKPTALALPEFPRPSHLDTKDSKENLINGVQK